MVMYTMLSLNWACILGELSIIPPPPRDLVGGGGGVNEEVQHIFFLSKCFSWFVSILFFDRIVKYLPPPALISRSRIKLFYIQNNVMLVDG